MRPGTAAVATGMLAALLAGGGVVAAALIPDGRVLAVAPAAPPAVLFGCFALAFLCAEIAPVHVELRRQTYSFSLSGLALVLGVLFYDAQMLVLARLATAALLFAWQRFPVLKAAYNIGAYTLETAMVGLMVHLLLGSDIDMTLANAAICFVVMGGVDLLMSALVLLVISWHQVRVTAYQAAAVFVPTLVLGAFCTSGAVAVVVLLGGGALGVALVVECGVVSAMLYRGYLAMRSRHQSLALMHDFVEQGVGASTVEGLAEVLLTRTRRLLHAGEVELTLFREGTELLLRVTEDDTFTSGSSAPAGASDWLVTRVRENAESIVIPRSTRERGMRRWLIARQAREAMLVPLRSDTLEGLLVVKDRLGETTSFTSDDLTLLQTLAGHIVVALRGTQLVQQLRHDAHHDALTGMANRVLLIEQVDQALRNADRDGRADATTGSPAVLLLDLDKFKEVNDALGHHVGDALLCVVGARVGECLPEGGTVARLGGDEFAVLLPGSPATDTEVAALRLADRILAALSTPVVLAEGVVSTRASIGIALSAHVPGAKVDSADLLRHADTAMYAAKAADGQVMVYTDDLDRGRGERLALLADLHLALERDELVMYYQPQLDLPLNKIVSVEALVRWQHPERGLLSPDQFIPLAESSGLIEELTHQVLRKSLRQCRNWRDNGLDLVVAVNLSAFNVNNVNLAEDVAAALADAGLPADRLVLEITESSVMGDPHRTGPILQRLADIGVKLSLDDFGTGYSSLAYLQRLPVSEMKIDKSFITELVTSGEPQASLVLVRSILSLGSNLGLRVVAEGVEDAATLARLKELGCDLAQGFHIARPQPAGDLFRLLSPTSSRRGHLTALAG